MSLKERFLEAVRLGKLGKVTEFGTIVTVLEFKAYFKDINRCYVGSFLPAAAIEKGRYKITATRYVFRVSSGVYRVHPDALNLIEADGTTDALRYGPQAPVFKTINP